MKFFLLNITYFIIILLGLNVLLYYLSEKLYVGHYYDCSLSFNSYLLSDSHGTSLKNFTEKYGVYNFSAASDSYLDISRKINFLIKNTRVDTIYITVDDHTLSPYREITNNIDKSDFFRNYSDYNNCFEYFKHAYLTRYIVFFQPKAMLVVRGFIYSKMKAIVPVNKKIIAKRNKIKWEELSVAERVKSSMKRLQDQFPVDKRSSELQQSLLEIINVCKANNIALIGLQFPLSSEYLDVLNNKSFGADKILKSKGLMVLDFKKVFNGQNKYFENQDHLNAEGGYKFVELWFNDKNTPKR
jgi:hypothetical protein